MERTGRITPDFVSSLRENEIFVFGCRNSGRHFDGASSYAYGHFGAVWEQREGRQGRSYAIPTIGRNIGRKALRRSVATFTRYAAEHPELHFLVTLIGCGGACWRPWEIAPMFRKASKLPNVSLPKEFWKCLDQPLRGLLLRAKQLLEYTGIVICGICLILVYLWMKLMPAKMLYRILKLQLSHDIWWEEWDLHEGMSWVTPCMEFEDRGPGKIRYILNHRTKRAYMVVDVNQLLRIVRSGDIDSESLRALPEELKKRIEKHESKYMFGVFHYRNGVAEVTWQVSPDGKTHYLDKYGNGRTTGETKIFLSGAIDTRCRVVKKLRLGPDPDLGMDSD